MRRAKNRRYRVFPIAVTIAAVGATIALGCGHTPSANNSDPPTHERITQDTLAKDVLPRLKAALPVENQPLVADLRASVTATDGHARVELESSGANIQFVMSSSFLSLQRMLIEASVIGAATTGYEPQLVDYAMEACRFALGTNNGEVVESLRPFWRYIGWSAERYETFRADVRFDALLKRATTQTLAWLVATAVSEHVYANSATTSGPSDSALHAASVRAQAANMMLRSRLAPVPAWPVAILFEAIRDPQVSASDRWVCGARDVLDTAIEQTSTYTSAAEKGLRAEESRQAALDRWRETRQMLAGRVACDGETP